MAPICFASSVAVGAARPRLTRPLTSPAAKPANARKAAGRRTPQMAEWTRNKKERHFKDWEDQGAGMTFANISGEGDVDVITMRIDAPDGKNQGYYRMAKGVTRKREGRYKIDSWGEKIEVPGWFSWENQGGGVAVAKQGPFLDLFVFLIDNPQQSNRAYYKVGYSLDEDAEVTMGWSDYIEIPGDFGWESQGGGIDVASISSPTQQDIVIFYIDNPKQLNAGYYRIGYNIDAYGIVRGGWSDPIKVPNWFSWENQGGGVSVYDTNGNGKQDIVIFFIDNPTGRNQAYYTIGRDLNSKGEVTGGWSDMYKVPDWFSWENEGGGLDVHKFGTNPPSVGVYFIDNPKGQNGAYVKFGDNAL